MRAIVIGGGIGGLACAIGLRRVGVDVTVYERAPALGEVGAGIGLWANALRACDALGVGPGVRARCQPMISGEFRAGRGHRVALAIDGAEIQRQLGDWGVALIHRAELVAALAAHLPGEVLRCGRTAVAVDQDAAGVTARFDTGEHDRADLLIGADGLHSAVRGGLWMDGPPTYRGYTCWRGVCATDRALLGRGYFGEWWGSGPSGARMGFCSLPPDASGRDRLYWWATANAREGAHEPDERAGVLRNVSDWAAPAPQIVEATEPAHVLRNDIFDRPTLHGWRRGRVVLIGDAAHPTTPNLGQGGCMALEDAVVLAQVVKTLAGTSHQAMGHLDAFERRRRGRTTDITRASRQLGWLGQRTGRVEVALRDWGFAMVPGFVSRRMMLRYARHEVGAIDG